MPKRIPEDELAAIIEVVRGFESPPSVDEISKRLPIHLPRRTLQRRLAHLTSKGRLIATGEGRGRRYIAPIAASTASVETVVAPLSSGAIQVSEEGEQIRSYVSQPRSARKPVGYSRSFLEDYVPNQTFYLTPDLRDRLRSMGRVEDSVLPAGTHLRQIFNRLLIDLSWNSSRLEGNTYSLLETQRLLDAGEEAEGKNMQVAQMILNHKAAIELLVDDSIEIGFNRYTICNLHALLSQNLLIDSSASGRLRTKEVGIDGSVFQPLNEPHSIDEYFMRLLAKADQIEDAFEQSFFVMVHVPYLQPFEDVNERVSRLAANIPLIRNDLCPLSFVDVPAEDYVKGTLGVYEMNRVEYLRDVYVWAYERSAARYSAVRQSLGQPDPFRLRYRARIARTVSQVVQQGLSRKEASSIMDSEASVAPASDRSRLVEIVETELMNLHEGNIARFRLNPSEYAEWKENWDADD